MLSLTAQSGRSIHGPEQSSASQRGVLWQISSPAGAVNYLFATVHISDPRVIELPHQVTKHLASSNKFAMEVLIEATTMQKMVQAMFYQDGTQLKEIIGVELYERALTFLVGHGVARASQPAIETMGRLYDLIDTRR